MEGEKGKEKEVIKNTLKCLCSLMLDIYWMATGCSANVKNEG